MNQAHKPVIHSDLPQFSNTKLYTEIYCILNNNATRLEWIKNFVMYCWKKIINWRKLTTTTQTEEFQSMSISSPNHNQLLPFLLSENAVTEKKKSQDYVCFELTWFIVSLVLSSITKLFTVFTQTALFLANRSVDICKPQSVLDGFMASGVLQQERLRKLTTVHVGTISGQRWFWVLKIPFVWQKNAVKLGKLL